jgi:hypothetical protein
MWMLERWHSHDVRTFRLTSQPFAAKTVWQDKSKQTTQHSPVISSLFADHQTE